MFRRHRVVRQSGCSPKQLVCHLTAHSRHTTRRSRLRHVCTIAISARITVYRIYLYACGLWRAFALTVKAYQCEGVDSTPVSTDSRAFADDTRGNVVRLRQLMYCQSSPAALW